MLNRIEAIGHLGTDPEMRYAPNGNAVTSFRLATSHTYTDSSGERRTETEWFTVVCWNRLAETVNEYVSKGSKVYAEGRLKSSSWTAQDGSTRFNNEIVASRVIFLDRRESNGDEGPAPIEAEGLPW